MRSELGRFKVEIEHAQAEIVEGVKRSVESLWAVLYERVTTQK